MDFTIIFLRDFCEMYSTYNEGKSVTVERLIRTLENNIFKRMTVISKNFFF